MNHSEILTEIDRIRGEFQGELSAEDLDRLIYSTDASVYQQLPAAVACPADDNDIRLLIDIANRTGVGLIPRAAGTSLAGQVVGAGIVVDISRHMNRILEINSEENWVRVQPGVIRSELNQTLAKHGLLFGPETSTSNRAMIGGMLGNNSCGSNSIVYGATRDQTLEVTGYLSDGTRATFNAMDQQEFDHACQANIPTNGPDRRSTIIQETVRLLSDTGTQQRIRDGFPAPAVTRRNMGYAVDRLIDAEPFGGSKGPLNLCDLIAGSEGTLFFATEIKLRCHPLPPTESGLFCPHFESVDQALRATQIVMRRHAAEKGSEVSIFACELIDRLILEGAARNIEQKQNLDFVQGSPAAILIVDLRSGDRASIARIAADLTQELQAAELGYDFPLHHDDAVPAIWSLRKAGLGVVANVVGDDKPVTLIEDTAVAVEDLPNFIREVNDLLTTKFQTSCVHYGHAGAGEIHLRPLLNLKTAAGLKQFREIATDIAPIVKKYRGSLSGEHGDGRLRGEFLRTMIGNENYELLRQIKQIWDPTNLFNPGKIIDAPAMDSSLRYSEPAEKNRSTELPTIMDFSQTGGLQRAAEMCSGSGDCRKTQATGGVMCPSYMATRNEKDSTRARANVLRQVLTNNTSDNPLNDERIKDVMDLCVSCKGCKAECPSNVDVGKMKAEFLHAYYQDNGIPRRAQRIANYSQHMMLASKVPRLSNWLLTNRITAGLAKWHMGFHSSRSLPRLHLQTMRAWFKNHQPHANAGQRGTVLLFCDEFTNFSDVPTGIATVELLERLGFQVEIPIHEESGRASLSQGLLEKARVFAQRNVDSLAREIADNDKPIIGIEPSAVLTLRDEYPSLVPEPQQDAARQVADRTLLIDEFIADLIKRGEISPELFSSRAQTIHLHGHCHQKALSSMKTTITMLELPQNYRVELIPSGCCGMAGAFGYEREHYDVSMQIGELILFPAIRSVGKDAIIAAGGTSCRHQIMDGTGRVARHPVEILRDAFNETPSKTKKL